MSDDISQPAPLIFAHRGARLEAPENTLPAFARAIALGADGIELDVHLTSDGVPVVLHDSELAAYTSSYPEIARAPWRAVQTFDASRALPGFAGTRIPSLREVLTQLAPTGIRLNIEIKSQPYWHGGLEAAVVALVREFGMTERVILSSFSPLTLWRLLRLAPDISRGLLLNPRAFPFLHAWLFAKLLRVTHLHPETGLLSPRLCTMAQRCQWPLAVWTANTPDALGQARTAGASIVITDDPALARQIYHESADAV